MRYGEDVVVEALIGFRNSLRWGLRECRNLVAQNLGLAPECIALRSYAPALVVPSLGEVAPPLDLLVESLKVKTMNRRLLLLYLLVPASLIVLLVSFACKFFLDHPQNFRVCWRGSRPSPVRG